MEYGGHQVRGTKTLRNLATDPGSSIWNLENHGVFLQKNIDIAREERSTKKVVLGVFILFYLREMLGYNQRINVEESSQGWSWSPKTAKVTFPNWVSPVWFGRTSMKHLVESQTTNQVTNPYSFFLKIMYTKRMIFEAHHFSGYSGSNPDIFSCVFTMN